MDIIGSKQKKDKITMMNVIKIDIVLFTVVAVYFAIPFDDTVYIHTIAYEVNTAVIIISSLVNIVMSFCIYMYLKYTGDRNEKLPIPLGSVALVVCTTRVRATV
ncbi:hypothetical protein MUO14_13265 [Halobacillus shinanisalinarum]|uniref:Uncharacterized protein n=1 Tax=Halobacillus shinanisalinarum TaxID=2932258 RepID=A0ABY4GUH3_9BACI|nr:hypothetical protein [Halobacillus shinanisalinarum]UOQ91548.1 hypothetical protein MUO14_13265 [Halobacillus shinanisalinarum]